jgi:hypothetical protein
MFLRDEYDKNREGFCAPILAFKTIKQWNYFYMCIYKTYGILGYR